MFIIDYIAENFIMLAELLGLWILLGISVHLPARSIKYTKVAIILILLDSVLFNIEYWTRSFETLSIWRPILSYTIYSIQPLILMTVIQIAVSKMKWNIWLTIPGFLNIILCFTSPWTHLVCYYSEDNHYNRGPLAFLPYAVFSFYVVLSLIHSLFYFQRTTTHEKMGIVYVIVSAVLGVAIYYARGVSEDYSAIFASAMLMYFLFIYFHQAKMDPLTGLMNRQCYYLDSKNLANRITVVASVDMNDLKWWNDTKGHEAGDIALQAVADCLAVNKGASKRVYRVGGDEFMIFYLGKLESEVMKDIEEMTCLLGETPYVCAFGHSVLEKGMRIEEAVLISDKEMYENKAMLKKKTRL